MSYSKEKEVSDKTMTVEVKSHKVLWPTLMLFYRKVITGKNIRNIKVESFPLPKAGKWRTHFIETIVHRKLFHLISKIVT
jgi:hypothetical protein